MSCAVSPFTLANHVEKTLKEMLDYSKITVVNVLGGCAEDEA